VEPGVEFSSGDLAVRPGVNSAIDCCAACHATPPCGAFTWGTSAVGQYTCWLKFRGRWDRKPKPQFTSGVTA
jgi:hypothetical protein